MSINSNITFVPDTTAVDAATARIKKEHKDIAQSSTEQINKIRYMWGYINQLATLTIGIIQRTANGTEAAATAAKVGAAIQVAQTQVAVAHFVMMGQGYIAEGNWVGAGLVFAVAAAMESSLVIQMSIENKAAANEVYAKAIAAQIEAYSV